MQVHYPKAEIIDVLNPLKQCSWSATITEQGKHVASMVMKRHHTYTAFTMQDKAIMVVAKQFCDAVSELSSTRSIEDRIKLFDARTPQKISGKCMPIRACNMQVADLRSAGRIVPCDMERRIIVNGGKVRHRLEAQHQRGYQLQAEAATHDAFAALRCKRGDL